jgi:hypothetical protein
MVQLANISVIASPILTPLQGVAQWKIEFPALKPISASGASFVILSLPH